MEQEFKVGDVVTLKSGGEPMTVFAVHPHSLSVVWWSKDEGPIESVVHIDAVEIHDRRRYETDQFGKKHYLDT